jgi:hypothetical protein
MLQAITEGLMKSGTTVGVVGIQQGVAAGSAAPMTTALIPSGIDEVSVLAAAAFSAQGASFTATAAQASAVLTTASEGIAAVAAAYDGVDAAGAARIL